MKREFDYLDIITILSFVIGLQAYEIAIENLKENQEQTDDIREILKEQNHHLDEQDEILRNQDKILYELKEGDKNEGKRTN